MRGCGIGRIVEKGQMMRLSGIQRRYACQKKIGLKAFWDFKAEQFGKMPEGEVCFRSKKTDFIH